MTLNPAETAILAMDFQPSILASLPDPAPLLNRVATVIAASRAAGCKVGTVRVAYAPGEVDAFPYYSPMGQRMKNAGDKVAADAPATQVVPEIGAGNPDFAVRKIRVGPFGTTDLDAQLKAAGINTVVISGIQTGGCVLTGARDAHDLDYRVIVLSDACADPDQQVHDFLMEKILPRQATVMTIAEYQAMLPGAVA